MPFKRVRRATRDTAGRAEPRRVLRRQLAGASAVAAFAIGSGLILTGFDTPAQPAASTSRALAPLGTGVVDPAVRPYLNHNMLKAVPVGPEAVSEAVQNVLTSAAVTPALDADGIPAAGDYLCAGGGNMANPAQETAAVLRYNDADEYARVVLALAASYEHGDYTAVPGSGSGGGPVSGPAPTPGTPTPRPTPPASPAPTASPAASPTAPSTAAPSVRPGQTVDIGWAPAMRQVVIQLRSSCTTASAPALDEPDNGLARYP